MDLMPMVMVCPHPVNPNQLLRNVLRSHWELVPKELAEDVSIELIRVCVEGEALGRIRSREIPWYIRTQIEPDYSACAAKDTEPCR